MSKGSYFELGIITKAHGLKGELVVKLTEGDPQHYKNLGSIFIEINEKPVPFFISVSHIGKNQLVISVEDINDVQQAKTLSGNRVLIPEMMARELNPGKFERAAIIGYTIVDKKIGSLSPLNRIYTNPGQDILSIDYKNQEVLIPFSKGIVTKIDDKKREIHVDLPEGLLDIYLNS